MGKLLFCKGTLAERPYQMDLGNINIYSIEELCFYIVEKLDLIVELQLPSSLVDWIGNQLEMELLASKLLQLQKENASNKALIQAILKSCNYYTREEIVEIVEVIEEIENLPIIQRKIKKANNLLGEKNYREAEHNFEDLINSDLAADLSREEYAQILHNLGIAKIYTLGIKEASIFFKQAYERNHKEESLKQYLMSLKISKQEDLLEKEIGRYGLASEVESDKDFLLELNREIAGYVDGYETSKEYGKVAQLEELSHEDKELFTNKAKEIVKGLQKQYR